MRDAIRVVVGICCAIAVLMAAGVAEAQTGRRVALVVGNAAYKLAPLANPVNDAVAVAGALERQLKFDKVLLRKNLSADAFRAALKELAWEARGAEVGLVFFAGHGIERAGRNYLIPTDAALAGAADIKLEAIALDTVLDHLDGVASLRLVILDACGPNPFPAGSLGRRGLGRIEPEIGTLVAYAARDGTLAADRAGGHSPFTQALLKRIATPGLDVRRVLSYVRQDVRAATGGRQMPWHYGDLGGDEVSLNPLPGGAPPPTQPTPADITLAWEAVKDSTDVDLLEAFRRQYGRFDEVYDRLAMKRIHDKYNTGSVSPPSRAPAPLTAAEERGLKPKDTFKECNECPEMVVVPSGSFTMGTLPKEKGGEGEPDESPRREVKIERPFAAGRFEVTFAEWDACLAEGGCRHRAGDRGWGRRRRPAIDVSWDDITRQYLPWLSRKTGKTYRLLTEAEWEYAARAGTTTRYAFGDTIAKSQAQFDSTAKTVTVGSFQPNAFGLYDMHGNVWEWVQDCWNGSYTDAPTDGSAWAAGDCSHRIIRGGSWGYDARVLRAANRGRSSSTSRTDSFGFRVGRTL